MARAWNDQIAANRFEVLSFIVLSKQQSGIEKKKKNHNGTAHWREFVMASTLCFVPLKLTLIYNMIRL